jgi:hypothetical protein
MDGWMANWGRRGLGLAVWVVATEARTATKERIVRDHLVMPNPAHSRRRPAVHITLQRAARLHRMVRVLAEGPRPRDEILTHLRIGLRTFYRELDLLKKCGVRVRLKGKVYHLVPTASEAEGRLPFPDPQLSFAEMAELAQCPGAAGKRLADLLATVINHPEPPKKRSRANRKNKKKK